MAAWSACRPATATATRRCWPATVLGIGNRWANRHTGSIEVYTRGRTFTHDIEPTQIGRVFGPDLGHRLRREGGTWNSSSKVARERQRQGTPATAAPGWRAVPHRKAHMLRKTNFDQVPKAAARLPVHEQQIPARHDLRRHDDRPVADRRRAVPAGLRPAPLGSIGQARPARLATGCARRARPILPRPHRRLSGDYDFQFMIEELAVGAQFTAAPHPRRS